MSEWKERHPFPLGCIVIAKPHAALKGYDTDLEPGRRYRVRMRGEDAHGLWVGVEGVLAQLPIDLFMAEDPDAVTDVKFTEVA